MMENVFHNCSLEMASLILCTILVGTHKFIRKHLKNKSNHTFNENVSQPLNTIALILKSMHTDNKLVKFDFLVICKTA